MKARVVALLASWVIFGKVAEQLEDPRKQEQVTEHEFEMMAHALEDPIKTRNQR